MGVDPISAIGLAANILQFIEYGAKLLSETRSIYHSVDGASAENIEIEMIAEHLSEHCAKLTMPPLPATSLDVDLSGDTPTQKIAQACRDLAVELLSAVRGLKIQDGHSRKWKCFLQALKTYWHKDRIRDLQRRMESLRSEFMLQLQLILSEQLTEVKYSLSTFIPQVDQNAVNAAEHRQALHIKDLDNLVESIRQALADYVQLSAGTITQGDLHQLLTQVSEVAVSTSEMAAKRRILSSLRFGNMNERQSRIVTAHETTFSWIFHSTQSHNTDIRPGVAWCNWLCTDEQIFWISGKPGSGKSTLMKFLFSHHLTRKALVKWAKSSKLVMAKFYFWNAGTSLQKSLQGLFQSLIFEMLLQCPDLIPSACATRWSIAARDLGLTSPPWDLSGLKQTFKYIIRELPGVASAKFCFFIDGLDEYDGDIHDILEVLKGLASSPHIKICLSSRPWNAFEDAFGRDPGLKLYLEDLTREDIRRYVFDKLENHLVDAYSSRELGKSRRLLQEVVNKAQGVFLWVFLVVRSLKDGLINGDSLQTLESRIRAFPSDLYDFFSHMFLSVDEIYQRQSAIMFRIALHHTRPLSLLVYSFLMEDDPNIAFNVECPALDEDEVGVRCRIAKKRLFARCQGLLEVYRPGSQTEDDPDQEYPSQTLLFAHQVGFLHRTVQDFLCTKQMWGLLDNILGQDFHPAIPLSRALLATLKTCGAHPGLSKSPDILELAVQVQDAKRTCDTAVLDELARVGLKDNTSPSGLSFLRRVIQHGLRDYLNYRLNEDENVIHQHGEELLACAVDNFLSAQPDALNSATEMIRILLRKGIKLVAQWIRIFEYSFYPLTDKAANWHQLVDVFLEVGADPNLCVEGMPVWAYYLRDLPYFPSPTQLKLRTVDKLLCHSADPNHLIGLEDGKEARSTVWSYFLSATATQEPFRDARQVQVKSAELLLRYGADPRLAVRHPDQNNQEMTLDAFFRLEFASEPLTPGLLNVLKREIEYAEAGERYWCPSRWGYLHQANIGMAHRH